MKKYTIVIIIFLAALMTVQTNAQLFGTTTKVGTTSAQFLKIGAGARALGMGGAYAAFGTDIYSVYWNPAGIALIKSSSEIAFTHANWIADMTYDFAAASLNLGGAGTVAVSFTSFQVPEDKVRTFARPEGDGRTWDAGSMAIGLSYAKNLTDRFSIGFNAKYIQERIWNSTASGFALDAGTYYRTPFNDLTIGAAILNFGTPMSLDGRDIQFNSDPNDNIFTGPNNVPSEYNTDEFSIPMMFRVGLAMDVLDTRYTRISGSVDAVQPNDNSGYVNLGAEFAYNELFFVRAGYKSLFMNNSEEGLTLGGGLKYKFTASFGIFINYAYEQFGRLKDVHFFDVGLLL